MSRPVPPRLLVVVVMVVVVVHRAQHPSAAMPIIPVR